VTRRANLSKDYFTNRQDRYHIFASKEITDYFAGIHEAVSCLSYLVQPRKSGVLDSHKSPGYLLEWPDSNPAPSPHADPNAFVKNASLILNPLIKPPTSSAKRAPTSSPTYDTAVYPLSQFTPILRPDTSTEHLGLTAVLKALNADGCSASKWMFTAGYFNIHPELKSLLLASKSQHGTVVTASPWANGFYGSKGISGLLPPAYTLLSRRFLESVHRANQGSRIELKEWRRGTVGEPGGWTYHAKGLWVTLPGESDPSVTLVGSSNYTKRSYSLDLEVNTMVVTRNEGLKRRLGEEQEWLLEHARRMTLDDFMRTERRVGVGVRVAMGIVELVGGAL
jgi:CDP-diacylglycerol--glycerol-3-phosphate 3-phosphatidyltransferase